MTNPSLIFAHRFLRVDQLHQAHIQKAIELPPYLPHDPDVVETSHLMKVDAGLVALSDAADDRVETAFLPRGQNLIYKLLPDSTVAELGLDIDGQLRRVRVGSP